tara:strand:+ start:11 stop:529 length:519 start_codon:yes stop_codon:yes gene_type:complete
MIHVEIKGTHMPIKTDGADESDKKKWRRLDPLYLLRMALSNKLRSKHWRYAHGAKTKWMDAAKAHSKVIGTPVEGPAIVVVEYALPGGCDIDAPVKVLLDAYQEVLFESGDDKDIESLILRKHKPARDKLQPQVHIYAYSKRTELDEARRRAAVALDSTRPCQPIQGGTGCP